MSHEVLLYNFNLTHFVTGMQEMDLFFGHTDGKTDGQTEPDGQTEMKVEKPI